MAIYVKEFKAKLLSLDESKSARNQALDFISQNLKDDQVISICENSSFIMGYSVAVWYKDLEINEKYTKSDLDENSSIRIIKSKIGKRTRTLVE